MKLDLFNGLNHKDIYRILRNNQNQLQDEEKRKVYVRDSLERISKPDIELENAIKIFRPFINKAASTENTLILINDLQNILNRMAIHIERDNKPKRERRV